MGELLVVFVVVLVLFGPRRLPEIARSIGRVLNELRRGSQEFKDHLMSMDEPPSNSPRTVNPVLIESAEAKGERAAEDDIPDDGDGSVEVTDDSPDRAG